MCIFALFVAAKRRPAAQEQLTKQRTMRKLLHTADWQIGKTFGQFSPEDAAILTESRFQAVEALAALAAGRQVDAILVAGDVFDMQSVSDRTLHRLFHAMSGYGGPWLLLPGNHDAALAESVWTRIRHLGAAPDNVRLCLDNTPVLLESSKIAVLPAPLTQRITYDDLTQWFDRASSPEGYLRIGLAHGSIQGLLADNIDSSNPIAPDRAATARLDYLALGDWHGARRIDERTWYSGTPETDRFRANDSGNALLVELAPGQAPSVSTHRVSRHQWLSIRSSLYGATDTDQLLARLQDAGTDHVLQLRLEGQLSLTEYQRLQRALQQLQGKVRAMELDCESLRVEPSDDDLRQLHAEGYLAQTLEELRQLQQGEQSALARDALLILGGLLAETRPAAPTEDAGA